MKKKTLAVLAKTALGRTLSRVYLAASFESWNTENWIHYSNFPMVKIKTQAFHNDPFGVYFFPCNFKTEGSWHTYRYKYTASIPKDIKVLDFRKLNRDDMLKMVLAMGLDKGEWSEFKPQIETGDHPVRSWWEFLQRSFMGRGAMFNKKLREQGYDAIFDDTKSIHSAEIQLLVLDPSKFRILSREERKGSGFEMVEKLIFEVESICKNYGKVTSNKAKKKWSGYDQEHHVYASITCKSDDVEDKEAHWSIETSGTKSGMYKRLKESNPKEVDKTKQNPPTQVSVLLSYHKPHIFNHSVGASFDIDRPDWTKLRKEVSEAMAKVWGSKKGL